MVNLINYLDSTSVFFSKFICQNQKFDFFESQKQETIKGFHGEINMQHQINGFDDYFSFSDKELQIVYLDVEDNLFFHNFNQLLKDNSQREIIKNKFYKGQNKTYPIECTILDLRPNIYNTKIQLLKHIHSRIINNRQHSDESQFEINGNQSQFVYKNLNNTSDQEPDSYILIHSPITKLELTELIQSILCKSRNSIKYQELIRNIIDCQYQSARLSFNAFFLFYFMIFIVPFLVQIFTEHAFVNILCHVLCMIANHIFFIWEVAQMKNQGLRNYFKDSWNYVDCAIYIHYLLLFACQHMHDRDHEHINDVPTEAWAMKSLKHQHLYVLMLPLMNLTMILLLGLKMLYFLRNFDYTSSEVEIIFYCVYEAQSLIFFLVSTAIFYTFFQILLGSNFAENSGKGQTDKEYAALPDYMQIFLQSWINSIGEFDTPRYEIWSEWVHSPNDNEREYLKINNIYITFIWIVWLFHQILSQVIMLNFIIAVVSEIYMRLQLYHQEVEYRNKCHVITKKAILDQSISHIMQSICSNVPINDSGLQKELFNFMIIFKATGYNSCEQSTLDSNLKYEDQIKSSYSNLLEKFMAEQTRQASNNIHIMMNSESAKNKNYVKQIEKDLDSDVQEIKKKIQRISRHFNRNKEQKVNKIAIKQDQPLNKTFINRNKLQAILNNQRQGIARSKKIKVRFPRSKNKVVDCSEEQRTRTPLSLYKLLNDNDSQISDQQNQQLQKFQTKSLQIPVPNKSSINSQLRPSHFNSFQGRFKVQKINETRIQSNDRSQLIKKQIDEQFAIRLSPGTKKKVKIRSQSNDNNILRRLLVEDKSRKSNE